MDNSPDLPAVVKHQQHVALRHWGDVTSLTGLPPAFLSPYHLRCVSPHRRVVKALGGHTQPGFAELRGTP